MTDISTFLLIFVAIVLSYLYVIMSEFFLHKKVEHHFNLVQLRSRDSNSNSLRSHCRSSRHAIHFSVQCRSIWTSSEESYHAWLTASNVVRRWIQHKEKKVLPEYIIYKLIRSLRDNCYSNCFLLDFLCFQPLQYT